MTNISPLSVRSLFIEMRFSGQKLSTGTGFVVETRQGYALLTNRHNVTGRNQDSGAPLSPTGGIPNEIAILHNRTGVLGQWAFKVESLYLDEKKRWIEHPTLGKRADFVALPLENTEDVEIYSYKMNDLGPNILVQVTNMISVVGFPFGLTSGGALAVWATGFIASEPMVDWRDLPILLIDCRSRQGQSGSPVVAYRGAGMVSMEDGSTNIYDGPVWKLLGIYSGRINDQSDLGIVWKSSALKELTDSL